MNVIALIASISLCASCRLPAASAPGDAATRTKHWQEDLDFFAKELPGRQKDFDRLVAKTVFERSVAELKGDVPQLSDLEINFRLARIVASLGVAHTTVGIRGERHYPVRMQWFANDLAVVAAAKEYREAFGCRVVRMGTMTSRELETVVAPYISHENGAHLHHLSPGYMAMIELMKREKIADAAGHLKLTCARADGKEFILDLAPSEKRTKLASITDALHIPAGLALKKPAAFYWYEYVPDAKALYIQYNKCHDAPAKPMKDFAGTVFAFADSNPVQRVVVDLRFNSGGDSEVINPLLASLRSRPVLCAKGHLYALIGHRTYSSAMITAERLRDNLHAILVGEATGGKPNHYGQAASFGLPHSKLVVHYSTKHLGAIMGDAPAVEPDIPVPRTLTDFVAGRDRALDTALHGLPGH
jgi:hypothetical protein